MMLGPFTLNDAYCGNNVDLMAQLPDECIDLTVTSPPYDPLDENLNVMIKKGLRTYNGYTWDFRKVAGQLWRVTKVGGVLVWVVGDSTINGSETGTPFRQALYFMSLGFRLHDTMIYEKNGASYPEQNRYYQVFEYMFVFSKGSPKTVNLIKDRKNRWAGAKWSEKRSRRHKDGSIVSSEPKRAHGEYGIRFNIWPINCGAGYTTKDSFAYDHPAMFPENLALGHVLTWSNPGDTTLDPFCGSGTTLKVAQQTGRNFLGFDISAEYVELSKRRIQGAKIPFPQLTGVL